MRSEAATRDLTEGSLIKNILLFSFPLILTNILQILYNAADMMIVGLSSEPDGVGAIGMTSSLVSLVINLYMGFATGTNIVLARHLGAKNDRAASATVHTSLLLAVFFGLLSTLIGLSLARPVLEAMGASGKLLDLATLYTSIYFCGAPFLSLANYMFAIFRAQGDTKTPLIVLTFTGILNVLLNLFFVFACHMSVEGVAIATVIANALSFFILLWVLARREGPCRFSMKELKINKASLYSILQLGLPAAIQGSLFSLSNVIIQSSILQINNAVTPPGATFQPVVKGNAALANLEGFVYTIVQSIYLASITFTSQHLGARKYRRIWRVMLTCHVLGFLFGTLAGSIIFFGREFLVSLYGVVDGVIGSAEHIAFETTLTRSYYVLLTYGLLSWMDIGCGVVRGLGKSTTSTVISLIGACLFRIAWLLLVFPIFPTLEIVYLSFPISWFITGMAQFTCAMIHLRRLIRNEPAEALTEAVA